MSTFTLVRTRPYEENFELFQSLPQRLYQNHSQRFVYGNEPVNTHLEGCYIILQDAEPVARFALYENPELRHGGEKAACFGSYECVHDSPVSAFALNSALTIAKTEGYRYLIGPMEGSTWNNYRFSADNSHPNFFGEPFHHTYYNQQFLDFGFESIARYVSNIVTTQHIDNQRIERFDEYYRQRGARIRPLDMDNFENELGLLARCSITGFRNNFLYTPISAEDFAGKYLKLKKFIDPELVLIAENSNAEIMAFVFAMPDAFDPTGRTLIIKSIVNISGSGLKGITNFLASKILQVAYAKGYTTIIHAFMVENNISVNASKNFHGMPYKSYTLYGKRLKDKLL